MIGIEMRWFGHAPIKPGRLPEPLEPVRTCDPPEIMAVCLSCPLQSCHSESAACPLRGGARPGRVRQDDRIRDMLSAGWRDEPLCRELGISLDELSLAKQRIRKRGRRR